MPSNLPILPTMGVGSYAAPGWCLAGLKLAREGGMGRHDLDEMIDDAIRITVADQIETGVDILSDGEIRRQRFVFDVFSHITGLDRVPPERKIGIHGYDMAPHFIATDTVAAPKGLGIVDEFLRLKAVAEGRPLKIALPGPLTLAEFVRPGGRKEADLLDEMIAIVRAELSALAKAGADYVQIDEPGLPVAPYGLSMESAADVINAALEGVTVRSAVHVCFGNNAGRPMADRRMHPLMPAVRRLKCDQLILEFANREMAEVDLLADLSGEFEIAAGVVDVKNWHVESAEDVARRIALCLEHVPADMLTVTADCGFSALPRYLAKAKMAAMTAGAALARNRV